MFPCGDIRTDLCSQGKQPKVFSREKLHPILLGKKKVTNKSLEELEHKIATLENRVKRL